MLMRVADDAAAINKMLNDRRLRPAIGIAGSLRLDASQWLSINGNVALVGDYGAALFVLLDAGVFEGHMMVLPEGRGVWSRQAMNEAVDWFFADLGGDVLIGNIPVGNFPCSAMARMLGMRRVGSSAGINRYSISKGEWLCRRQQLSSPPAH